MFSFSKHIMCLLLKNEMLYKITNNDVLLNFSLPLLVFKTKTIFWIFTSQKNKKKKQKEERWQICFKKVPRKK